MMLVNMLVRILDHDNRRVHHGPNRDCYPSQRHDVGVDALQMHDDKRQEHRHGQRNDGHERTAEMQQEQQDHQRHHDGLFQQLVLQVADGALDEVRAVVCRDDFHVLGQAGFQAIELGLDGLDDLTCIFAGTHHNDAADHFAFAIKISDTPTRSRAEANLAQDHAPESAYRFWSHQREYAGCRPRFSDSRGW